MWLLSIQPHLSITVFFSSETQTLVIKGLTHDSAVSLPLYCLNRCVFVAPALTGTPPRWFISPLGLLAAAGDQTEEPWLSHQGNESEEKKERKERNTTASLQPLCSQATLCSHLSMSHIQMHPISPFAKRHNSNRIFITLNQKMHPHLEGPCAAHSSILYIHAGLHIHWDMQIRYWIENGITHKQWWFVSVQRQFTTIKLLTFKEIFHF